MCRQILSALGLLVAIATVSSAQPAADLIIVNGRLWTADAEQPEAEAVAVWGERIVAVGRSSEVESWRGARTRVIDGYGRRVVPGFNDAHLHFFWGGQQLESVDLRDAESPAEFRRRIEQHAAQLPEGEWIVGGNWDDQRWSPPELPTRDLIDAVTATRPVFVVRYDGHMGLANTAALQLAGITAATPDPPGGLIVRHPDGTPTGVLKDAAMAAVERRIPALSRDQRLRHVRRALAHAASLGVTSVQHMGCSPAEFSVLAELAEAGQLTVRVYAVPSQMQWQDQSRLGIRRAFGSTYLRLGAVKGFSDGSLGSSTAYFFEPYTDDPRNRGLLADEMQPHSAILQRLTEADAAHLQLCLHAIGDEAISRVLDLFTEVRQTNGLRDRRSRIEHAQHVAPKDFERFRELDVIASVQPYHAIDDGRWAEARIGPVRAQTTYAFRTFLDQRVRLAFGTDWPVAPLNPLYTVYAAVTRATLDGRRNEGWVPQQRISVAEAVEAYTLGSAYAEFQEAEKGAIRVGQLADLVMLDRDIFSIPPAEIREAQVDLTIVGGRIVWDRSRSP